MAERRQIACPRGHLLLSRAASDVETARLFAERIETKLLRQLAELDIARRLYLRGSIRDALRALGRVDDARLAAHVLRSRP